MSKHTPGPWEAADDGCIYAERAFIGEAHDLNPSLYNFKQKEETVMANARLMAAAPELLEAIKESMWYIDLEDSGANEWYLKTEELIAKIEGDEN